MYSNKKGQKQSQGSIWGEHAKDNSSTLCPKRNKDECVHFDSKNHNKNTGWKKYPQRTPVLWYKDGSNTSKPDNKYCGQKDSVIFNFAVVAILYNHELASHVFLAWINKIRAR